MNTRRLHIALNLAFIFIFTISLIGTKPVSAQTEPPTDRPAPSPAGFTYGYDSQTGLLNFVGGDATTPLLDPAATVGALADIDAGAQVLAHFGPAFGLANPADELHLQKVDEYDAGVTLRYQQQYQGIPVLGGELLLNRDAEGKVLSLNGEVSPALTLRTTHPAVSAARARSTALAGIKTWYGMATTVVQSSEPELWVYDPAIFEPSDAAPVLVWRVDLTGSAKAGPVNELVLVNAATGRVALHLNQVNGNLPVQDEQSASTKKPLKTQRFLENMPGENKQADELFAQVEDQIWYVAYWGTDRNDCATPSTPCETVSHALSLASNGDTIRMAAGTYTSNRQGQVVINMSINLIGGWTEDFTLRNGYSIFDGRHSVDQYLLYANGNYNPSASPINLSYLIFTHAGSQEFSSVVGFYGLADYSIRNSIVFGNQRTPIKVTNARSFTSENLVVAYNDSSDYPGIILNHSINTHLQNTAIVNNTGSLGGGITADVGNWTFGHNLYIKNTIIANNSVANTSLDCNFGSRYRLISEGYNLIKNTTGCNFVPGIGDITGQDPMLDAPRPDGFYRLLPGSPAIDAGNPEEPDNSEAACGEYDIAGQQRPLDGNGDGLAGCDIGAYENGERVFQDSIDVWAGSAQLGRVSEDFAPLMVRALGADGYPLVGATVIFRAPESGAGGIFADGGAQTSVLTGSDGTATAPVFTANSNPGIFIVEAFLDTAPEPAQFQLETYLPEESTFRYNAGDNQVTGLQQAFPLQLQVEVRDQYFHPLERVPVSFTGPVSEAGGIFTGVNSNMVTVLNGSDGIATAPVFTSNSYQGAYYITAHTDGIEEDMTFRMSNTDNLYISPSGTDSPGNNCRYPETPCLTLKRAYDMATSGAVIHAEMGTYPFIAFQIKKNLTIIGGLDGNFSTRVGYTEFIPGDKSVSVIDVETGNLTISGVRISDARTAIEYGGDLLNVSDCVLIHNVNGITASSNTDAVSVKNCTVSNNDNGLFLPQNSTISYSTIVHNRLLGVSFSTLYPAVVNPTIDNSILGFNGTPCKTRTKYLVSNGYNIFEKAYNCVHESSNSGQLKVHATDKLGVDPGISDVLINNTHYALTSDSPAVDAADPQSSVVTDVRGVIRPINDRADIGSFEYTSPGPVANLVTTRMPQVALPKKVFFNPIKVLALDHVGSLVPDVTVNFDILGTGASASFIEPETKSVAQTTGIDGAAQTPPLHANEQTGWYEAIASVNDSPITTTLHLGNGTPTMFVDNVNGDDQSLRNDCRSASAPCKTLNNAIEYAHSGDMLALVAGGKYQGNGVFSHASVYIDRDLTLSGGWDSNFTQRSGRSVVGPTDVYVAKAVIDRIDFSKNSLGIQVTQGYLDLNDSRIQGNWGTAIQLYNKSTVLISNAIISGNEGGISAGQSNITLTNVVISQNHHGLYNRGGDALLTNVTITDNRYYDFSEYYDGKYPYGTAAGIDNFGDGSVRIINSIIANNLHYNGFDCLGEIISLGHNLIGNSDNCQFQKAEGDIVGTWEQRLSALVNPVVVSGGGIDTVPLLAGSPAIDSADPTACPETDQRGMPRPVGAGCDMGAYEGSLKGDLPPTVVTLTAQQTTWYPGKVLCETPLENCTGGADINADLAHRYALDAYRMFFERYGRISIDNAGMAILSTVHSGGDMSAFWNGRQLVYTDYFVVDDVGVHEYAHGINQYSARLLNYYQTGAISESLSDMWGEYYDQTNGIGNDVPEVKWMLGEDLEEGAVRSMKNPPQFKHPDRMGSKYYWLKPSDNGGIHMNSGVNNKAIYLMVEGGIFNKLTIAPIGWGKVLDLYYYTQTHLLTSGAGYDDLYTALNQACTVMTGGPEDINTDDCVQVRKALDAVEMRKAHKSSFNPDASVCPSGMYQDPNYLFRDDFENGDANWTFGALVGNSRWIVIPDDTRFYYAASGKYALFGDDFDSTIDREEQVSDTYAAITTGFMIPPGVRTELYFNHAFGFEYYQTRNGSFYTDGGVLEYSIDDGVTWLDAKSLNDAGLKYSGKLYNSNYFKSNPLRNRYAFRGESHGYVASRYNLSKLAGKNVHLRWRLGTDYMGYWLGWAVDDVSIYTCVGKPGTPLLSSPSNGGLVTHYQQLVMDWKDASYTKTYDFQLASDPSFSTMVQNLTGLTTSNYTLPEPLIPNSRYYWRVRAINAAGIISKWSSMRYFRTAMTPPVPDSPANESVATNVRPAFQWSAVPGATSYSLQVSKYANLSRPVFSTTVKTASFTPSKNLSAATTYYWRVKANGANPSDWSQVFTFTTP